MKKRQQEKALLETESIVHKLVSDEVKRVKDIYEQKKKQETEILHNRMVDVIQEINPNPQTIIFVLEIIKSEVLRQFLGKVKQNE